MALDAVGRLIRDESRPFLEHQVRQPDEIRENSPQRRPAAGPSQRHRVLVIDDPELSLTLIADGVDVVSACDNLLAEQRVAGTPVIDSALSASALTGIDLVLMRLPKSVAALDEYAGLIAAHGSPDIHLVAGGRDKHMTKAMNAALARHFRDVRASLGRQKCRVLHAGRPIASGTTMAQLWPKQARIPELGLTVMAHGAAFAGATLDAGTRLLLTAVAHLPASPGSRAIDLGCGTGILATWLAQRSWRVTAVDVSRAACLSASATAAANGVDVAVVRANALWGLEPESADLIVCNPPFHVGTAKDSSPAFEMIRSSAAVLRPHGEFWCVFNSHLPYLGVLRTEIGPTRIVQRDRAYTVTRSVRSSR